MRAGTKKPKTELADCAASLLQVSFTTPTSEIERLIEEGYLHLEELKATVHCNPTLISALDHRIKAAEEKLEGKRRIVEAR